MKIVCFSDTHGFHGICEIPECDILIFAGDYSGLSDILSTMSFAQWMQNQPAKHKIVVPGNHDYYVNYGEWGDAHVLIGDTVTIEGIKFFGSPYTPEFCGWNYMKSYPQMQELYTKFPEDVDFLITHGAPYGILDEYQKENIGCKVLKEYVAKVKPKYHVFGHIHNTGHISTENTEFYNVSLLDHSYNLVYNLTVLEI